MCHEISFILNVFVIRISPRLLMTVINVVTFVSTVLYTIQIVSKQLHNNKQEIYTIKAAKLIHYEPNSFQL